MLSSVVIASIYTIYYVYAGFSNIRNGNVYETNKKTHTDICVRLG